MRRFAALMCAGLNDLGHDAQIIRPSEIAGRLSSRSAKVWKWLGYVDKLIMFPFALKAAIEWADVVHICDHSNSFYVPRYLKRRPHVVTCHDMLAVRCAHGEIPENQIGWAGRHLQSLILNGLRRAHEIVCVSDATKAGLLRLSGLPETRISRIDNGLNYPYSPMDREEAAALISKLGVGSTQPFVLHVGGNQWYKNRLGVLRVFSALRQHTPERDFRLVMVGKPWTTEMRQFVLHHRLERVVAELIEPTEQELQALYSTATMLLFPSLQEGFGWPIIEAQSCGCPVVTSNRPPMNVIGGDGAIYIDPDDAQLAALTIVGSLSRLRETREAGLRNAERFSTPRMIDAYADLYRKLVKTPSPREPGSPALPYGEENLETSVRRAQAQSMGR